MNMLRISCAAFAVLAITIAPILPAHAFPALFYKFRPLRVGPNVCAGAALEAMREAGMQNVGGDANGAGGTTDTSRAVIHCSRLPGDGPCNGDGTSLVVVVASDHSGDDALAVLDRIDRAFGDPILFDCN